jgi:WD40 repeat protein
VWDDGSNDGLRELRAIENAHNADIKCMDFSYELSIIVTGCASGSVRVWDFQVPVTFYICCSPAQRPVVVFQMGSNVGSLRGHTTAVTSVAIATGAVLPLLASADTNGLVILWCVVSSFFDACCPMLCDVVRLFLAIEGVYGRSGLETRFCAVSATHLHIV